MQEKELIQYVSAAERKDNAAMEILYKEFYQDVVFICRNFKLNEEDCEDIAQDTFIKAFSGLDSLQDKGKFKQWLLRIANNKCLDLLRHNKVLDIDSMYEGEEVLEIPDKTKSTDELVIEKETEKTMMSIIEKLPIEQRVTVFLFFYQDYSVKEIASMYGCTESTVRSRLNYAKKFMHKEIEKLESNEIKHRCIVLLPFLYVLFSNQREAFACEVPNALNVVSQVMLESASMGSAAVGNVVMGSAPASTSTANVLPTAISTGKAVAFKMSMGKIFAIIAMALVIVGGGIGAAVYFSSNQEENETTGKDNEGSVNEENGNSGEGDNGGESGTSVDKEVAELIANAKKALSDVSVFDVHSAYGFLFGIDDMYVDAKNVVFENWDGDWYIEKEADGKVYIYEPYEERINAHYTKRELTEEEVKNLDYIAVMTTLLDAENNMKARVMTDDNGNRYLSCNMNLSVLEALSKYLKFDMIVDYTINEKNVKVDLHKLSADLNIFIDDEYRIKRVEIDSEKLAGDFYDTLTDKQKESMVMGFDFSVKFDFEHEDHIPPFVSDEIKQYAVPYTIGLTYYYEDDPLYYMCNVDCGWDGDVDMVYMDELCGMKNGMEVSVFGMRGTRFSSRNEVITREDIEKKIKGSGGYSSVFGEVESYDILGFEWEVIDGKDVGMCHTECEVENNYTTIVAVNIDLGDEKRVICIQVTDRASVTYEGDDATASLRKEVALAVIDAMEIITLENPIIDREDEWY